MILSRLSLLSLSLSLSLSLPLVPPMITESPENTTVVSPDNAIFNCVATARPRPAITWWRREENGSLTQIPSDSGGYSMTNTNSSKERVLTSTLTIIETEPSDALIYICVAENIAGTTHTSTELTVHGKCSLVLYSNGLCSWLLLWT